jgi:hypothetical protein
MPISLPKIGLRPNRRNGWIEHCRASPVRTIAYERAMALLGPLRALVLDMTAYEPATPALGSAELLSPRRRTAGAQVAQELGLHEMGVEDALETRQRPKLDLACRRPAKCRLIG